MNLFTLLALFAVVALAVGTLAGAVGILWFLRKKSWKLRGLLLLACCIPITLGIGLVGWLLGPADYSDPEDLKEAYHTEFAEFPSPDVSSIQCRQIAVGDAGAAWLRFQASPQTVDRILKRFTPSDRHDFNSTSGGGNVPPWWQPDKDPLVSFYRAENWNRQFSSSEAVLAHDAAKGIVYFHHSGSF